MNTLAGVGGLSQISSARSEQEDEAGNAAKVDPKSPDVLKLMHAKTDIKV